MGDLPKERLISTSPPFSLVGIDLFGPFLVKRARTTEKRYGVIFSCLTIRAVHIEIVGSLETTTFINALRRFIARRGQVTEIRSDNGTNFVGTTTELKKALADLNHEAINKFATRNGFKWNFNPPAASHFGGVWERMIRSIRKVLRGLLAEQHMRSVQNDENMQTLFCEIEAILNNRPLTPVNDDPADMGAITPMSMLTLKDTGNPPFGIFRMGDCYSRKRWRQVQWFADQFWKRWRKEFIPLLQEKQKWLTPHRNLSVNDLVLVADNDQPRNEWLLGRIVEIYPDKTGTIRSAKVKTQSTELVRPIHKLCLILEA